MISRLLIGVFFLIPVSPVAAEIAECILLIWSENR